MARKDRRRPRLVRPPVRREAGALIRLPVIASRTADSTPSTLCAATGQGRAQFKNAPKDSPPMRIDLIPAGASPPASLHVLIAVPIGGWPGKYKFDKEIGKTTWRERGSKQV